MKISLYPKALLLAGVALLAGCKQGEEAGGCRPDPAASAPVASLPLKHLEHAFFQIKNPAQGLQFLQANPAFARYYLQVGQAPSPNALANSLAQLATNPDLEKLGRETAAAFPDSASLRHDLGTMFGKVHYYFPDFKTPPVAATYVSGLLGKDIFVNDSLLVLSLDWYIGPKASYRPDLPGYMLRRYRPANLLPTLATAVAGKYVPRKLAAPSVLDEMISQGKRLYFAGQVLPCAPDTLLMGYTRKELSGLQFNEAKVWGHFLENNLLYSSTPFLIQKYVAERPNVPEIDATCPGRVGQWVGLQIIRKYMAEHPGVTLAQLMAEKDAQRILTESHYRPKKS
ncbi:gliding motility lipoprotein GldB [Hymenobacter sp. BT559]|uniref:gliding motility protein GldB-related protein n=1 Tax=Hymenobacter sp. BT559 TaxID=2795729 RepID=UPI0018ED2295|nr:gliding motility lipoprotein GldB [Hymenobacter sp. BT559]MBJ6145041.1 gliding motility lipoprotein GldB [Hymenobacter sp. BT559]